MKFEINSYCCSKTPHLRAIELLIDGKEIYSVMNQDEI